MIVALLVGMLVCLICVLLLFLVSRHHCNKCQWEVVGRLNGLQKIEEAFITNGKSFKADTYLILARCKGCKTHRAIQFIDCEDDDIGGIREVDPKWAEYELIKAGVIKNTPTAKKELRNDN